MQEEEGERRADLDSVIRLEANISHRLMTRMQASRECTLLCQSEREREKRSKEARGSTLHGFPRTDGHLIHTHTIPHSSLSLSPTESEKVTAAAGAASATQSSPVGVRLVTHHRPREADCKDAGTASTHTPPSPLMQMR